MVVASLQEDGHPLFWSTGVEAPEVAGWQPSWLYKSSVEEDWMRLLGEDSSLHLLCEAGCACLARTGCACWSRGNCSCSDEGQLNRLLCWRLIAPAVKADSCCCAKCWFPLLSEGGLHLREGVAAAESFCVTNVFTIAVAQKMKREHPL